MITTANGWIFIDTTGVEPLIWIEFTFYAMRHMMLGSISTVFILNVIPCFQPVVIFV